MERAAISVLLPPPSRMIGTQHAKEQKCAFHGAVGIFSFRSPDIVTLSFFYCTLPHIVVAMIV